MPQRNDLLERDTALTQLDRLYRAASRGGGHLALLSGEAGVGKSTVIRRFVAGLEQRAQVLWGWCDPLEAPRPLGPLIDMLAEASSERKRQLMAAVEAADIETIYSGLVDMFGNETAWLCVVEDAHWADGATLDLLRFLCRRIDSLPLLLLVSFRDDEIGDQHPLAVLLGDLATSAAVTRIGLSPLTLASVTKLAEGSGINADELYGLSGGNPFYVTEVLATGPAVLSCNTLPRTVSEAVRGRLARLSSAGRETAYATAVCGPRAELTLVQAVCPAAQVGLAECQKAGVLVADAQTVGFRHELGRLAALDQIPAYQRCALHKRALTVLAETSVKPDTLAALVFHADKADDSDAVIRYGPAAAERAASLRANREAAELYALTLRHADGVIADQKVTWLERHAFCSYLSGLCGSAVESWQQAIALRHELDDRFGEGEDLYWLSLQLYSLGATKAATAACEASLGLLEDSGPCPQLAWSLATMAMLAAYGFDPACSTYADRAIRLGARFSDDVVVVRARFFASLATVMSTDTGWHHLEAVWREAMATEGMSEQAGMFGALMCWFASLHHHLERAERYISETSAFCAAYDMGMFHSATTSAAALVALHRGDWVNALESADDILTRPAVPPNPRILSLVSGAMVHARRGEQPVFSLLDDALIGDEKDDLLRLGPVWAARAEAAWLAGDDDTARAEALSGLAVATEHADPWLVGHLRRWAYLAGGPFDDAPTPDTVTPYRFEISGDWQAAVEEWTRLDCPYDAALANLGGDAAAVAAALDTFRGLGARPAARRAQQRLAQLRGTNPDSRNKATIADPYGLTEREREVLELLVEGHSDAEIAAALFISPKTANRHVGAILSKLGVRNRTQAAAYARRQSPSRR